MRAAMREIVDYLKSDLFEETHTDEKGHRAFTNPGGFKVVVTPRADLRGVSGWVEDRDGKALVITSYMDVQTLSEVLP
jgi:hypothetical protein